MQSAEHQMTVLLKFLIIIHTLQIQWNLNITKAKGRGLAMFIQGVMPLDGISGLLIQMFLSGVSAETAEIKARTTTTTSNFIECKGNT